MPNFSEDQCFYDLDLSDEHMEHVSRFLGLGPFVRTEFEALRGYRRFKLAEIRARRQAAAEPSACEHK
jgi:hypothetical protein